MTDSPTTHDPVELAMEAEAAGSPPSGEAALLIRDQRRLVGWQIASERAGFALKVLTGAAGAAAAVVLAVMAWQASRATGVVVKPFSVPPALAQRGVTGEAVAARLLDQLARIGEAARSSAQERRVAADGGGLSLEIPATGISIGQLEQWLRVRLGKEQRVTGELSVEADGRLALQTRLGARPLPVQSGSDAELNALILKTAEAIYQRSQNPRSYVLYLGRQGRWPEVLEWGRARARSGSPRERAAGYADMGRALDRLRGDAEAAEAYGRAIRLGSRDPSPWGNLSDIEYSAGRDERAYRLRHQLLAHRFLEAGGDLSAEGRRAAGAYFRRLLATSTGDYGALLAQGLIMRDSNNLGGFGSANAGVVQVAVARAWLHDIGGARDELADTAPVTSQTLSVVAAAAEDWAGVVAAAPGVEAEAAARPDKSVRRMRRHASHARALAKLGRVAEAEAVLAATPLDCAPCVISRGIAAEARGDRRTADHWFGQAARMTPSLPFANHDWGRALLARGDAKGALDRFDAAHRASPRHPDSIEGRGEALLALGDAKGATAAFAEAAKLTPKWGRLHLKWGRALAKLGRAAEAQTEFRMAATLDLTPAERAELTQVLR